MKQKPTEEFLAILRAVLRRLPQPDLLGLRERLIATREHPDTIAVINWEVQRRITSPGR